MKPLERSPKFPGVAGPVVVVVMDGIGIGKPDDGNAVHLAKKPTLDWLNAHTPLTQLQAHGRAVGLPSDDDIGNSEVGHNALGAGRIFDQGAKLVNNAIASGSIWKGEAWIKAVQNVKQSKEPLHFLGLLSDGNVHSHIDHLLAMINRAATEQVRSVRVHALLDGRDVPETSALTYVEKLENLLQKYRSQGFDYWIASGGGRMKITMDRYEADWPMVEKGWNIHVRGQGRGFATLTQAITTLREEKQGISDQNLPGFIITDEHNAPRGPIRDGASVILFNFRGDRAIEISRAFEDKQFSKFNRGERPQVFYTGMMQYDGDLKLPSQFLVSPPEIEHTLAEYLNNAEIPQLAISETQKFGHVTYFWNGNCSQPFNRETWIEIPSDSRPFEERPWMKSAEITDRLIDELRTQKYRHARVNYANGDMVGHTGSRDATVIAVEAVDLALARLLPVIRELNGAMIITADHGNADEMIERDKKTGAFLTNQDGSYKAKTSHTINPVPCFLYAPGYPQLRYSAITDTNKPGLGNIAATVFELLGFVPPSEYLPSLLQR